jgi:predicted regulator of Ras-like GTPase activity (Roadblock/LC7/MglB family)
MSHRSVSWAFEENDAAQIDELLQSFLYESQARCVLLVDRTGQLIMMAGERPGFDSTAFASLAAADFSANDQLASMIGEQEFSSLFHQGERDSMYLADVAKRVIFVVLFDDRATLGMIRIKVRTVVLALSDIFSRLFQRTATQAPSSRLEGSWVDEAEDEIDRLFGSV